MDFRVLGPIELLDDSGARVRLVSTSQRRLVAILAANAGQVIRSEVLEDALELSAGALRTAVSRLRRIVGFDVLVTDPPGYALCTDHVDAIAFERRFEKARSLEGKCRIVELRDALGLWHGDAYDEFAGDPWALAEAVRLDELRAGATELLAECELRSGDTTTAIARLDALIATRPFADRPHGLLMEALDGSGRRSEALRVYDDYRRMLAEEVGNDPGPELAELDRRVATGRGAATPFSPLPSRLTGLVGRESELDVVVDLVCRNRLTTLTGAGGCGKTSLALEAARRVVERHGIPATWVEMATARDGDQVVRQLVDGIGATVTAGIDPVDAIASCLHGIGTGVVVVDDAEQVVEQVGDAVVRLLSKVPDLRVLVTSRVPLDVPGEVLWRVPSLSLPPQASRSESDLVASGSGRLLVSRVRAGRPGMRIEGVTASALASICHRVEGLPLALELAAGRMRSLSATRVAAELSVSRVSLASRAPGGPDRHRTMRACIEWSIDLLAEEDRLVIRRLAGFESSFDDEAALAVLMEGEWRGTRESLDCLARLVDANLVALDERSGRYRMSEAIREICLGERA